MPYSDKEKQRESQRLWKRRQNIVDREKAIVILGGKCVLCGNSDKRVLHIDHITPILRTHAKRSKTTGIGSARDVIFGRVTDKEVQLVCANCHMIKSYDDRVTFPNYKL